jgi:hypothetical protein
MEISASMSMTLDMLAGMASYVGRSTTGAAVVGAGSEAAIVAAIEVAIFVGVGQSLALEVWSYYYVDSTRRGISMNNWLKRCLTLG